MFERSTASDLPRTRLRTLYAERDPQDCLRRLDDEAGPGRGQDADPASPPPTAREGLAGRLTERWVPGGGRSVGVLSAFLRRHRGLALGAGIAAVAGVLVAVGLHQAAPEIEAPPPLPAAAVATIVPTATRDADEPVVVSVVGKVAHAGLVTLSAGSRVADAIAAAGGGTSGASLTSVNLARKVHDGEQIYVGIPRPGPAASVPAGPPAAGGGAGEGKIDINTANAARLDSLPGIGPATAKKILRWREEHGRFGSVDQLRDVDGIGDAKMEDLRALVTVG